MGDYKYKAFISYSHKDRKWTRWLHRRLETYPIPKNIIGNVTSAGAIPRRLKPIFRDREELSASNNLGEKIEAALASSKNLIIICSPAAAKSKWVNQEILTFKQNNRDAQLFSVIVEGEPYASTMPGREAEECFPPALRFEVNPDGTLSDSHAEPLAADLRPHADGKRLGFLKLISGMIGVGLDDVVQRDMKRSRKRVTAITTGSLATVLVMGTLTGFALDARAEAEQRQSEAEGLIDFMLVDFRRKVEPLGRLDILDDISNVTDNYYRNKKTEDINCDDVMHKARANHLQNQVHTDRYEFDAAEIPALKGLEILQTHADECSVFPKYVIALSHAEAWAVWPQWRRAMKGILDNEGSYEIGLNLERALKGYRRSYTALAPFEKWGQQYELEKIDIHMLVGSVHIHRDAVDLAWKEFQSALTLSEPLFLSIGLGSNNSKDLTSLDKKIIDKHADVLSWIADVQEREGLNAQAFETASNQRKLYNLLANQSGDLDWPAFRAELGARQVMARNLDKIGKQKEAFKLLQELETDIKPLINNDETNQRWDDFLKVVRNEKLAIENNLKIER